MAYKNREELLKEIEEKNKEIKALKKDVEKLDRYKIYADSADEFAAVRDSFVNAGFSKAESFELMKMVINQAAGRKLF